MKIITRKVPLCAAALLILCSTGVYADESAGSAKGSEQGVVPKVEKALGRAAKATEKGIERGAKATAHGIEVGTKAAAHGIERGAQATASAAHRVAEKIDGSSKSSSTEDQNKK